VKTAAEIKKILSDNISLLKEKCHLKEIGIFGSYLKNEQTNESDLDLLVEFESDAQISLIDYIRIENFLSDLLDVKVDLVEKSALKPRIGKRVLQEVSYV